MRFRGFFGGCDIGFLVVLLVDYVSFRCDILVL